MKFPADGPVLAADALLSAADGPAFSLVNPQGTSPVVLVCDHACNRVPGALNNLGLSAGALASHIAWDPGAAEVARRMSALLDAPLVLSGFSRLVIDCNRPLASPESIIRESDGLLIPGNQGLTPAQCRRRIDDVFLPYQRAIADLLQRRKPPTALLSIHSFTPVWQGLKRPWQVGLSGYRNDRLARRLHQLLLDDGIVAGYDQPYAIEAAFDYTLPTHGEGRGLAGAMIEIRQDEIDTVARVDGWARQLVDAWHRVGAAYLGTNAGSR